MKRNSVALLVITSLLLTACVAGTASEPGSAGTTAEPGSTAADTVGEPATTGVASEPLDASIVVGWQQAPEIPGFEGAELGVAHIGDDVVIVMGTPGADAEFRHLYAALERDSGELRWSVDLGPDPDFDVFDFHTLREEVFVVGLGDPETVQAFDVETGDIRWQLDDADFPEIRGDYIVTGFWNEPGATYDVDTGERLFVGQLQLRVANEFALLNDDKNTDARLVDLPSGEVNWGTFMSLGPVPRGDSRPWWDVQSSPDAAVAAFRDNKRQVVGVDLQTGEVIWTRSLKRAQSVVSPDGKYVAIQKSDIDNRDDDEIEVEMVEVATGETAWSATVPGFYLHPIMTNDVLVASKGPVREFSLDPDDGGDEVDVEVLANEISGYDVASGKKLWTVNGLEDSRVRLSTADQLDEHNETALLLIRAGSNLGHPSVSDVQLLDLVDGQPIGAEIPAEFTEDSPLESGIAIAGRIGVYIDGDRIRSLDGADVGSLAGTYKSAAVENGAIAVWSNDEAVSAPTTITFFERDVAKTNAD